MRGSGSTEVNATERGAINAVASNNEVSAELRIDSDILKANVTKGRSGGGQRVPF